MRCKLLTVLTVFVLLMPTAFGMGNGGKPYRFWTPDGMGYWWYNNNTQPALCRLYYPNGFYYDFWLYPGLNTPVFANWQQSDCNYY